VSVSYDAKDKGAVQEQQTSIRMQRRNCLAISPP
jgi:hypothetical protein